MSVYLLEPDGRTFTPFPTGQTGMHEGREPDQLDDLIQKVAKIARYGVYFQIYKGHIDIFGDDWKALTQCHLIPLLSSPYPSLSEPLLSNPSKKTPPDPSIAPSINPTAPPPPLPPSTSLPANLAEEDFNVKNRQFKSGRDPLTSSSLVIVEELEEAGIVQSIVELASSCLPRGAYLVPVFAHKELLMGIMVVQDIDNIPYALYKRTNLLGMEKDKVSGSGSRSGGSSSIPGVSNQTDKKSPLNRTLLHQDDSEGFQVQGRSAS